MRESVGVPSTAVLKNIQEWISPALVTIFQVVTLLSYAVLPFLAVEWIRTPFIGGFVEHTMMVNTNGPTQPGTWELHNRDLPFGYQLVAVEGQKVNNSRQLQEVLRLYKPGDVVRIDFQSGENLFVSHEIRLSTFPNSDLVSYFIVPYVIGLIYLFSSLYIFSIRRHDATGRAFVLFTSSVAICAGALFEIYTTHYMNYLWTLAVALCAGALINLAMIFPQETRWVTRHSFLRWVGYIPAFALTAFAFPTLFNYSNPLAYVLAWRFEYLFLGLAVLFFLVVMTVRRYRTESPVVREQTRLILGGSAVSFSPLMLWFFLTSIDTSVNFSSLLIVPIIVFPLTTAYAILRYRLLNTDYLLNRAMLYAALSVLAGAVYALIVAGLSILTGEMVQATSPLAIGLMVFLLAVLLNPARTALQQLVDSVFFRGQMVYRSRLQEFGHELTQAMELPAIIGMLRKYAQQSLVPTQLHIFVHDPLSDHYVPTPDENNKPTTDIRFPASSIIVQTLGRSQDSLFIGDLTDLKTDLQPEQARLALLGSQLFVPLPGRQQLIGWLAMSSRRSGEPYTNRDLNYLESLGHQSALAVERAQVVGDLERRVRETNVLTRVAQGINFTLTFDDILELIYAQTNQVIPALDFRVTLYHKEGDYLYHAFYLENDDRLSEQENHPLPDGRGLEGEVVRTRRSLVTDDYERECRSRGSLPASPGLYAWMGVPMNAGADTIGVISLGSRDTAILYTDEQCSLLQAIADQASGAIIKARLLQETERRARQLATLNEIGRSLTSTLELKPLLNQILKSATEILNCAAGSLFLVDEQTDELVFEVVIGPVASDLVGRRLPSGTGLVGEAVDGARAIIANNAKRRKEWFDKTDIQTGFDTQDLLVVPMQVKDRIVGVIEVINKLDGSPFDLGDQELLTTFTSQATIAIENARLYTLTDQALTARVEELSVMQRIDRELNTSLETDRAMHITLDWALRQSEANAGLVGTVENGGVRIMTAHGYTHELEPYKDGLLPLTFPALQHAVQTGQPQSFSLDVVAPAGGQGAVVGLLENVRGQVAIPIRREANVIGVLMLESTQPDSCSEDVLAFLSRLSDHAAIAIANAQLYTEVQAANMAKSKFVSFVAHELKNPMASIKGYTELVAGGMAGPINEMQGSFLSTVRSNVDRMNTIVTDLNDLTKIQVGSMRLEFRTVQVKEIVEEAIHSLRRQIDEKELTLDVDLPGKLPLVWADPTRLGQVMTNLVSNAHKYTQQGGKILVGAEYCAADETQPVAVEVVHVWVQDTGIGIPEEDQPKIFSEYFRTEMSKEAASGTGLGLNISKSLVEMQGGRIWFESQVGKGTTFHFTVPVAETT